jgi:hypothetical protein
MVVRPARAPCAFGVVVDDGLSVEITASFRAFARMLVNGVVNRQSEGHVKAGEPTQQRIQMVLLRESGMTQPEIAKGRRRVPEHGEPRAQGL